jgi:hypothetical protein
MAQHRVGLQAHKGVTSPDPIREVLAQGELLQMLLQMGGRFGVNALNFGHSRIGSAVAAGGGERGQDGHEPIVPLPCDNSQESVGWDRVL